MKSIKSYFTNFQEGIDFLAALLLFFLPLSKALPNVLLIPLGLLVIFNFKKLKPFISKPSLIFAACLAIVVVLAIFKGSFLEDFDSYSKFFLIFVLLFLFLKVKNHKLIEHFFLLGIAVAIVGSSIAIGIHLYQNPGFLLDSGGIVNKLLWLERPYFGIILSFGTFICLKNAEKFKKNDYYLLALLFVGFSIYISARLSILINCLLIFIFLLKSYRIQRGTKIWTGFVFVILIALAFGLSDNLMSRMRITNDLDKTIQSIKAYEPRLIIWPCAAEIIQNDLNLIEGLGSFDEYDEKLTNCYAATIEKQDKREYYLEREFNTHNQFLDILLMGGILPLLVLIFVFFHVWFSKKYTFELKMVFLMFFLFFLVENALHRQLGCYLLGIFVALYARKNE